MEKLQLPAAAPGACDTVVTDSMESINDYALRALAKCHAVISNSHVVYTSGKHGSAYVNKDAVYPHTQETSMLCAGLADAFRKDMVDVVIAPAIGGVILSQWVAHHLCMMLGREVLGLYAEKEVKSFQHPDWLGNIGEGKMAFYETGQFIIKRGYDKLINGKRVLVTEDVVNTGGSVRKVVQAVRDAGGIVVGVGALCNRSGRTPHDLNVSKLVSLVNITLDMWDEEDCPLCAQNVPINTDVGKGREFLARKRG